MFEVFPPETSNVTPAPALTIRQRRGPQEDLIRKCFPQKTKIRDRVPGCSSTTALCIIQKCFKKLDEELFRGSL